jgi:hypothetical protein
VKLFVKSIFIDLTYKIQNNHWLTRCSQCCTFSHSNSLSSINFSLSNWSKTHFLVVILMNFKNSIRFLTFSLMSNSVFSVVDSDFIFFISCDCTFLKWRQSINKYFEFCVSLQFSLQFFESYLSSLTKYDLKKSCSNFICIRVEMINLSNRFDKSLIFSSSDLMSNIW